jgi:predicted polyphosphate/ATP-dependent NAD kinase
VSQARRVGLIVNPIAGMGGAVGLKGTDGPDLVARARELGATARSPARTSAALRVLAEQRSRIELVTCPGLMGELEAREAGFELELTEAATAERETTAEDTRRAAARMTELGVELLLFAGGDGTAQDIFSVLGCGLPVVGIPTGVKIQSGVFAVTPHAAGMLAAEYVAGTTSGCGAAEVMDLDEERARAGIIAPSLIGYLAVPQHAVLLQGPKVRGLTEREESLAIAQGILALADERTQFVFGPGTTTGAIVEAMDLPHTLLGVDVVCGGRLVVADVTERQLFDLVSAAPAKIVVSPIGGQGYLFGRGNQQISARVLEEVGVENVIFVASETKLASLRGQPLRIDLDDDAVATRFSGFARVLTGDGQFALYPVGPPAYGKSTSNGMEET